LIEAVGLLDGAFAFAFAGGEIVGGEIVAGGRWQITTCQITTCIIDREAQVLHGQSSCFCETRVACVVLLGQGLGPGLIITIKRHERDPLCVTEV
jgi:hypothetical protein